MITVSIHSDWVRRDWTSSQRGCDAATAIRRAVAEHFGPSASFIPGHGLRAGAIWTKKRNRLGELQDDILIPWVTVQTRAQ
jgi:hypothetical protein